MYTCLSPLWRYEAINLFRKAYNRGELKLPKDLRATCPNKTAFNRWLNIHYQKSWISQKDRLFLSGFRP